MEIVIGALCGAFLALFIISFDVTYRNYLWKKRIENKLKMQDKKREEL